MTAKSSANCEDARRSRKNQLEINGLCVPRNHYMLGEYTELFLVNTRVSMDAALARISVRWANNIATHKIFPEAQSRRVLGSTSRIPEIF